MTATSLRIDNTHENTGPFTRTDDWSEYLNKVGAKQCERAFGKLFDHFAPLIKGFCLSRLSSSLDPHSIDDLIQEVFTKIWINAKKFDPAKASASTWIFTVARNARIDYLRKISRHSVSDNEIEVDDLWDIDGEQQQYKTIQRSEDNAKISTCLKDLPKHQSQCIYKVYMEGKTHLDISEELKIPLGTVKSRVRLGMTRLRASAGSHQFSLVKS